MIVETAQVLNMQPQEETLYCADCNCPFVLTAFEQNPAYYKSSPKRCQECRLSRKLDWKSKREETLFETECAGCHRRALITLKPRVDKIVYCRVCFKKLTPEVKRILSKKLLRSFYYPKWNEASSL